MTHDIILRLVYDTYPFLRAQSFISCYFGRQYHPSRTYAEMDM